MRPLFLVFLASSLVGFQVEDSFSLVPKRVKGDVVTYDFSMNFATEESEFKVRGKSRIKVLAVADDGGYELEESSYDNKLTIDGEEQELPAAEAKIQKYDSKGKRIQKEDESLATDGAMNKVIAEVMDFLPDHPVKIGETWTRASEYGDIKSTLEAKEKVGEVECFKVVTTSSLGKKGAEGDATSIFYVRTSDFSLEKGSCKIEKPKFDENPGPKQMTMELTRTSN